MSSTRLPGKVLRHLQDKTVLAHVLDRCKSIPGIDAVCCATTVASDCDQIVVEAERCGVEVYRGSESDVLERYHEAAKALNADIVFRVTSDCPVIDPSLCGQVLAAVQQGDADYACNNMPPTWPHGLDCEAFAFAWLDRAAREARRPSEREHVTPYLRTHNDVVRVNIPGPGGELTKHRWTLDTESDYQFFLSLFERLPAGEAAYDYRIPLSVVEKWPDIAKINAGHDRFEGLKKSQAADQARGFTPTLHD